MGQDCSSCCTTADENKQEINDDGDFKVAPGYQKYGQGLSSQGAAGGARGENGRLPNGRSNADQGAMGIRRNRPSEESLMRVVRVQSLIRGFLQRRRYRIMKLTCEVQSKYFKSDEAKETLNGVYRDEASLEHKVYTYRTGAVYTGQWKGGLRHGKGTMVWVDSARYEGDWNYNQACGNGKFFHTDGDIYDGNWMNNKANGFGIYTNVKGARYEGYWKEDQQHGNGVETWPEGAKYQGEYVMSKKEGRGKYTWADGSTYEGQWLDNKIHGYGVYLWKDGRKYYGQWESNDMQGLGIYIYADGVRYDGQYFMDKKEGFGVYYWTDGRKYEGWWHKGKQHGLGTYIDNSKGNIKYGLWENGKRVKWFDEQAVILINQIRYDFSVEFKEAQSQRALKPNCTFERPQRFNDEMNNVKRILSIQFK